MHLNVLSHWLFCQIATNLQLCELTVSRFLCFRQQKEKKKMYRSRLFLYCCSRIEWRHWHWFNMKTNFARKKRRRSESACHLYRAPYMFCLTLKWLLFLFKNNLYSEKSNITNLYGFHGRQVAQNTCRPLATWSTDRRWFESRLEHLHTHSHTHSLTSNPLCVFRLLGGFLVCAGNPNPFFLFFFGVLGPVFTKLGLSPLSWLPRTTPAWGRAESR